MPLESTKRNQDVCAGLDNYQTQIVQKKGALSSIAGDLATLKAEIIANVNGYYNADDITFIEAKITAFKALATELNDTVQAL